MIKKTISFVLIGIIVAGLLLSGTITISKEIANTKVKNIVDNVEDIIQKNLPIPTPTPEPKETEVTVVLDTNTTTYERIETKDLSELNAQIELLEEKKAEFITIQTSSETLEYSENHIINLIISAEIDIVNKEIEHYTEIKEQVIEEQRVAELERKKAEEAKKIAEMKPIVVEGEYAVAKTIWNYLKNLGYNDYVCAGILGNMMAEVGGNTLDIQYWLYNSSKTYYGICQWSVKYYPQIQGASLENQLNFLAGNIKAEIDMFGNSYRAGFNYDQFTQITDSREAALAFARCYERGASKYDIVRMNNAVIAYSYFVG